MTNIYIPDDIWINVKDYLFHNKFEAIELVQYHAALPYALGLHNYKGISNNMNYLKANHAWVFTVLCVNQVIGIIKTIEQSSIT